MVKVSVEGGKVTSVPRLSLGAAPTTAAVATGVAVAEPHEVLVAVAPDAQLQPSADSALTTETPTPCRPPETL